MRGAIARTSSGQGQACRAAMDDDLRSQKRNVGVWRDHRRECQANVYRPSLVLEEFNTSNRNDATCQLNRDGERRFSEKCLPRGFDMRVNSF
jgi:hypothetical protein